MSSSTWKCPKCGRVQIAIAKSVSHRCPSNKGKPTAYERVENG